jgi:subtilisin-like proprotein convertase family protein
MNGYCIMGMCRNVQCAEDMHCQAGLRCVDNACVPGERDCTDNDGDGFGIGSECGILDCDDNDANVNPNVIEDGQQNCGDGVDNNCDGIDVMCAGIDNDGDGYTEDRGDCDDNSAAVNPGQTEQPYNQIDDDCNPRTSDTDVDGDGYDSDIVGGDDCDDMRAGINPEANDIPNNGIDEDCDGSDRVPENADRDMDGVTEVDGDCNDDDASVNPNAVEVAYNGKDDDCDPNTRDNDLDGDMVDFPEDCDDNNANRSPDNEEIYYNGIDDDCDAMTNDTDADGDGYDGGLRGDDCNDAAAIVNPDADETPYNGIDDDCDAATPDDDLDGDGFNIDVDCDDALANVNPEIVEDASTNCSDGIDNNCRGGDVECQMEVVDTDGDGIPDDQDCAPGDENIPGPIEIANNGVDDDCNEATLDACDEDEFDLASPNGSSNMASIVQDGDRTGIQYGGLRLCQNDTDWYRIDVQQGDGLEVDLFFDHQTADIDVTLYRATADGRLQFVDQSVTITDNETVWTRRADSNGTYLIQVLRIGRANSGVSYGMTVNVFNQCTDDESTNQRTGYNGEHNDALAEAVAFPEPGTTRQICDYDEDWYTFELQRMENVQLDLFFDNGLRSDLDLYLYNGEGQQISASASITNNESIERMLDRGTYYVRVRGVGRAQNDYRLFRSSGMVGFAEAEMEVDDINIPEFADGMAGVLEQSLRFEVPAGSVIRNVRIEDMVIEHDWLRDLRVTALWDDQEVAVLWNREGDANGDDGGLDDDFLPFTGSDINFDNRDYAEFLGRPAGGTFTLRIEDLAAGDDGELTSLRVRVEYLAP